MEAIFKIEALNSQRVNQIEYKNGPAYEILVLIAYTKSHSLNLHTQLFIVQLNLIYLNTLTLEILFQNNRSLNYRKVDIKYITPQNDYGVRQNIERQKRETTFNRCVKT